MIAVSLVGFSAWGLALVRSNRTRISRGVTLLRLMLLLAVACSAWQWGRASLSFARQVRAQLALSPSQRRAEFLKYQTGLSMPIVEQLRVNLKGEAVYLQPVEKFGKYRSALLVYYLAPTAVFFAPRRECKWRLLARSNEQLPAPVLTLHPYP